MNYTNYLPRTGTWPAQRSSSIVRPAVHVVSASSRCPPIQRPRPPLRLLITATWPVARSSSTWRARWKIGAAAVVAEAGVAEADVAVGAETVETAEDAEA